MKKHLAIIAILALCTGCSLKVANGLLEYENDKFGGLGYGHTTTVKQGPDGAEKSSTTTLNTAGSTED